MTTQSRTVGNNLSMKLNFHKYNYNVVKFIS